MMWDRVTCPDDEDDGSTNITDGSTSHTIMELEDGSSYTITVTASNAIGSGTVSEPVSGVTNEIGKYNLYRCIYMYLFTIIESVYLKIQTSVIVKQTRLLVLLYQKSIKYTTRKLNCAVNYTL